MNKLIYVTILVSVGAFVCASAGLVRTINGIDNGLSKLGNRIELRVENVVHPPPHQSGNHGIFSSAVRGVGRLLRNVTAHAGKFAKGTVGAVGQTVKEATNRVVNGRKIQPPPILQPETVIEIPEATFVQPEEENSETISQEEKPTVESTEAAPEATSEVAPATTEAEPATTETAPVTTEAATVVPEAAPATTQAEPVAAEAASKESPEITSAAEKVEKATEEAATTTTAEKSS